MTDAPENKRVTKDLEDRLEQALAAVRAGECDGLALICLTTPKPVETENGPDNEEGFTYFAVMTEAVERLHVRIHRMLDNYHERYYAGGHGGVVVGSVADLFRALGIPGLEEDIPEKKH